MSLKKQSIRTEITEMFPDEEFLFADGYDDAVIGIDEKDMIICYDRGKIIEILMKDMSMDEAEEFFSFNIIGAYMGEKTPRYIMMRGTDQLPISTKNHTKTSQKNTPKKSRAKPSKKIQKK